MVKDGGGWWKKAEPQPTAGRTSTNLHQLPPSSTPSCSPAHLHLNHGAVVTHLWSLLPKHFVVGDHLEVVATPEILDAREISGLPIAGDAIARVELFDPSDQLDPPRHRHVRAEGVPAPRVHAGPAILLIDVLGARGGPLRPVHALGVDADAVAVALERSAQVEPSNRGEYGARDLGAVRRPRRDAPFHREPGAPQEVRRGVTERLEARLEVAGELWRRRGGSRRLSQRRSEGRDEEHEDGRGVK